MGLNGATDRQLANSLVKEIRCLNKRIGIKPTFKENGVTEDHFLKKVVEISQNAEKDPCTSSNPRETDARQFKQILTCAFYGDDVTF